MSGMTPGQRAYLRETVAADRKAQRRSGATPKVGEDQREPRWQSLPHDKPEGVHDKDSCRRCVARRSQSPRANSDASRPLSDQPAEGVMVDRINLVQQDCRTRLCQVDIEGRGMVPVDVRFLVVDLLDALRSHGWELVRTSDLNELLDNSPTRNDQCDRFYRAHRSIVAARAAVVEGRTGGQT